MDICHICYPYIPDLELIRQDIQSRLWFSYRKGFVPIGDSGLTSDKGWGCMLRCGQMLIAQALLFLHLGEAIFVWFLLNRATFIEYCKDVICLSNLLECSGPFL